MVYFATEIRNVMNGFNVSVGNVGLGGKLARVK